MEVQCVPEWLQGVWTRRSIRRAAGPGQPLGPPDSSVCVLYLQTPSLFFDLRIPSQPQAAGLLAFAGLASAVVPDSTVEQAEVSWHACFDLDKPQLDSAAAWAAIDAGHPAPTDDVGIFSPAGEEAVWVETDPAGSLEEIWCREAGGPWLAARMKATGLLVACGDRIGAVWRGEAGLEFRLGTISPGGRVVVCTRVRGAGWEHGEGEQLRLPGCRVDWVVADGSTAHWPLEGVEFSG